MTPLRIGDGMSFRKTLTVAEQAMYTGISGNMAPLYVDRRAAADAGFDQALAEGLTLPGPFERARFLGLELRPGALAGAAGMVRPTGVLAPVESVADEAAVARRRAA